VTAYDKYAIQAFDAHAIDYLLKPFSDQRFDHAIARARKYLGTAEAREQAEQLTAEPRLPVECRSLAAPANLRGGGLRFDVAEWRGRSRRDSTATTVRAPRVAGTC